MRYSIYLMLCFISLFTGCTTISSQSESNQQIANDSRQANSVSNSTRSSSNYNSIKENPVERLNDRLPEKIRKQLETSESLELLLLDSSPFLKKDSTQETISSGQWQRYKVIGKTKIDDSTIKEEVINALYEGVSEGQRQASCFSPLHGIRAMNKGRKTEIVICFRCSNFYGISSGEKFGGAISKSPQELFNRILTEAGVLQSQ